MQKLDSFVVFTSSTLLQVNSQMSTKRKNTFCKETHISQLLCSLLLLLCKKQFFSPIAVSLGATATCTAADTIQLALLIPPPRFLSRDSSPSLSVAFSWQHRTASSLLGLRD